MTVSCTYQDALINCENRRAIPTIAPQFDGQPSRTLLAAAGLRRIAHIHGDLSATQCSRSRDRPERP